MSEQELDGLEAGNSYVRLQVLVRASKCRLLENSCVAILVALGPSCDGPSQGQREAVTDSVPTIQDYDPTQSTPTIDEKGGQLEPVPGGGGCEGCVSCFHRRSLGAAEVCFKSDVEYVGASLKQTVGDDVPLSELVTKMQWHLYGDDGNPFCSDQGCRGKLLGSPREDYKLFLLELDYFNEEEPRRISFGMPLEEDVEVPQGPSISIPSGVAPRPASVVGNYMAQESPLEPVDVEPIVHITFPMKGRGFGSCSGALVSDRHVLTAAHCFGFGASSEGLFGTMGGYLSPQELTVRVGGRDSPGEESYSVDEFYSASSIAIHPQKELDLALVELAEPVTIKPLPRLKTMPFVPEHSPFEAYGYGVSRIPEGAAISAYDWGRIKRMPLETTDDLPEDLEEREALLSLRRIDERELGPCRGDSGGPLIHRGSEEDVLVGVMLARAILEPGDGFRRASYGIEPMMSRAFEFSRYNSCGIGKLDDTLRYIAVRLDRPKVSAWIDRVVSDTPGCSYPRPVLLTDATP